MNGWQADSHRKGSTSVLLRKSIPLHPREKKSVCHMDTSSTRHHGELEVIADLMTE